ncbi:MAG: PspC domain-containing protein [Calditrichaeota bacterium]|nr:MAG: PspC domain-containing protein [Calditrichota bacterium]
METDTREPSKLYRSRTDRYVGGVCGGLAQYFNVDSTLIRLLFVLLTFIGGIGVALYIAALILVPENPREEATPSRPLSNNTTLLGVLLVVLGALLLLREWGIFQYLQLHRLFSFPMVWAVVLIAIGAVLLYTGLTRRAEEEGESRPNLFSRIDIQRSRSDRKIAGVCGGIAKYYHLDSTLVRLGWVLGTLLTSGLGVLLYIILMIVLPEESPEEVA